jgi:hypothetical protein
MARQSTPKSIVAADAAYTAAPSAPEGGTPAVRSPRAEPSGAPDPNLAALIAAARDPEVDVAKLERIMGMVKEREEDNRRRAFYAALAAAKGEWGPILKTRVVDYPHKERDDREERGRTKYKYEELADISAIVDPILSKHGLTYRHRTVQSQGGKMTVTCILSHADGYSEENSLEGLEDKSGQKNPNQAIASTVTYLQRYTLKEALGIGAGRDDDAGGFDDPMITADDAVYIDTLIADTGSDLEKLLKTVGAESVADMHASQFKQASWLLETVKRRERKKAEASEAVDGTAQP